MTLFDKPRLRSPRGVLRRDTRQNPRADLRVQRDAEPWHLVVWPEEDGQLGLTFQRLFVTHATRAAGRGRVADNSVRIQRAAALIPAICFGDETLAVVQKPTFWIVGQWTRILVQTPADCEPLEVDFPDQLELLGSWPHRAGDATQRFYFRATALVRDGQIPFRTARDGISLPIRVLSWHEVLPEKFTCEIAPGWSWTGTIDLTQVFPLEGYDERNGGSAT